MAARSTRQKKRAVTAGTSAACTWASMKGANVAMRTAESSCRGTSHDFLRPKDGKYSESTMGDQRSLNEYGYAATENTPICR